MADSVTIRYVRPELLEALGPIEKILANEYLKTGHWVLIDQTNRDKESRRKVI